MSFAVGKVLGIKDRSTAERAWFVVVIQEQTVDREGFPESRNKHLQVFAGAVKDGLHNSYRQYVGTDTVLMAAYQEQVTDKGEIRTYLSAPPVDLASMASVSGATKPLSTPANLSSSGSSPGGLAAAAAAAASGLKS